MNDTKFCRGCQRTLPLAAFYVRRDGKKEGRQSKCKECDKASAANRQRQRRHSDPAYRKAYNRRLRQYRRYGEFGSKDAYPQSERQPEL